MLSTRMRQLLTVIAVLAPSGAFAALTPEDPPALSETSTVTLDELRIGRKSSERSADMAEMVGRSLREIRLGSTEFRYALNFFADLVFDAGAPTHLEPPPAFALGPLAFLVSSELGSACLMTAELAYESHELELERMEFGYDDGSVFLWLGRSHTPIGYWNSAFHHGTWLQPVINRPRVVRFEDDGGLIPTHWVGLSAGVNLGIDPGTLRLTLGTSNGRGPDPTEVQALGDVDAMKAVLVQLSTHDLGARYLSTGVGAMFDRIPESRISEQVLTAFAAYRGRDLTLIAEAYAIRHSTSNKALWTLDGFAVLSYSLERFTPYVFVELERQDGGDSYFHSASSSGASDFLVDGILGLRIDISAWSSLRTEYKLSRSSAEGELRHHLQLSVAMGA